jgi:hypothetical protein
MTGMSELPLFHVIGFSGHRQLADPTGVGRSVRAALEQLRRKVPGEWIALSSVAEGGDSVFVGEVLSLPMAWHAILPLPRAEFAKDFSAAEWVMVEEQLGRAEAVQIIGENGSREDAYLDCGTETVSGADVLMAVWDGQPARGKGGTAEVVEYARALGKPLILINPATLETQRENWHKLESTDSSLTHLNHLAVALVLRAHHHSQHSWVRCRLAAEFCRSALATWGLPRTSPLFQDLDLPEVRGLTRALHILHSRSAAERPISMGEFRDIYLSKRIDDQLAYYKKREARALPLFLRLKVGFWVATLCALACTLVYAVSHTAHWEVPEWTRMTGFYFLPIALPVVAAAFISLISINDLQRRVARYREMQLMLEQSRKQVTYCRTWNSLERIVMKTERSLLQEVLEWHSLTSFAESH